MPANSFFDTSILLYAVAQDDRRTPVAEELLARGGCISVQVLNELVAVARRKLARSWKEILEITAAIRELCEPPLPLSLASHDAALLIAQRYKFHIYDSLVVAAALEAGCTVLYTEDLQDGQTIESLRIRNPFRKL